MSDIEKADFAARSMRARAIATLGDLARDPRTSLSVRQAIIKKLTKIDVSAEQDAAEAIAQLALIQDPKS